MGDPLNPRLHSWDLVGLQDLVAHFSQLVSGLYNPFHPEETHVGPRGAGARGIGVGKLTKILKGVFSANEIVHDATSHGSGGRRRPRL